MTIDWANFTPWSSFAGGLPIGVATALFLLFNGRIAGISGIVGGLLRPARGDIAWRLVFIFGLKAKEFRYRAALLIAGAGIVTAPTGVWMAQRVNTDFLSVVFRLVLLFVRCKGYRHAMQPELVAEARNDRSA